MKIRHIISIFLLLWMFNAKPHLMAEEDLLSKCNCELKGALKKAEWQKAFESAEKIITKSPVSNEAKDAYLWLGLYHKSQYDYPKSIEYYTLAAELFPGTWTSAEAYARTGCDYYKLNNYRKAREYFRKAGEQAKTWQQRKYASAWAKWVHFAIAANEQQVIANCATKSIDYYLNSKGIELDEKKLGSSLTLKDGLAPLSQILEFLEKEDIKLQAVKCPLNKLEDLQLPLVAAVKPSHLIVVKDIDAESGKIRVYDPYQGDISYYEAELSQIWREKVLSTYIPSEDNLFASIFELVFGKEFAHLTESQLDDILLGACYCCPQDIIPECDEDSDDCSSCNGEESGVGGSGGSGTGGSGCPGCGFAAKGGGNDFGFPKITVHTSTLGLMVRDTPIGYSTPLGEDVRVTLTYNSDQSHSGIFGNGWHSNLESKISENPNVSATVRRSGGHDSIFEYSGGQYNPPIGCSNKLTKKPNDTFTLEYTKSHRKYHYDSHSNGGKLLAIEDQWGNTLTYQYDANNNFTSITDAVGRVTNIETDAQGRITEVNDPLGRQASFIYDANGNLAEIVDMAGNAFTYTYDENKNITSLTEPKGTYTIEYGQWSYEIWVESITDPNGNTYQYGGERPTYVIDPRGNYTEYYAEWYYGDTVWVEDDIGNYIYYTYDNYRNKTGITDKRGNTTTYTYDSNHNRTSKTDPLGNQWSYVYDANNNLVSATDTRGKVTLYVYNSNNSLLSVTEKDPNENVLSVISYTYDSNGLRTSMTNNGATTIYSYDPNGNLVEVVDPESNVTTFGYDTVGRKTSMTNDSNATTTYEYDDLNRITKITHPDSSYIEYTYNCCGLSQKTDENGNATYYEYDNSGRLTKVTDAQGNETTYTYDGVGNLLSVKDAKGNTTNYTYDALNRVTEITYPLGDSESYTYDAGGNVLKKTDGNGLTTYYVYDKNNRLIEIKH
jgi:YD repeat-containing protein